MNEKNIIVRKGKKTRRARESELTWFKQRGWIPASDSATNAPTHQPTPSVSASANNHPPKGN